MSSQHPHFLLHSTALVTLAVLASGTAAQSATPPTPRPITGDVIVPTLATADLEPAIAPPETLPLKTSPLKTLPLVPGTSVSQSPRLAQAVPPQLSSLSEPVWVVPTTPTEALPTPDSSPAATVTVPPLQTTPTQRTAVQAPTLVRPTVQAPDLVVPATDVQIVGVDAELQQVARNTIKTQPGSDTSAALLRQDVTRLLETGLFANASVSSSSNAQGLNVLFQLQPMVVRSLRLSNAQVLTLDRANLLFQPQLNAPVTPSGLTAAVRRINQWYAEQGYALARVLSLEPSRDGQVTITVAEGVVGDVQIQFVDKMGRTQDEQGRPIQHRTQTNFVRQQLKVKPGEVFRQDVAQQDLKRLSALGIFAGANVKFAGDANRTTVIYNLVEAPARGVNLSGGYNEDLGIFGSVNFQDANVGGQAKTFGSNVQVGTRDVQFDARFVSPYRDTQPDTLGYSANVARRSGLSRVFDDDFRLANGQQVRERRIGGGITLDRPIAQDWMGSLGLNYTNVSLRDRNGNIARTTADGLPLTLSGKGIDDLTTLSFTATRDLRNNFSNPSQGSVLTLSTEQFIPIGRGNVLGNRLQANYAEYLPVNWIGPKDKPSNSSLPEVFAFNVQGGTTLGDLPPYNAYVLGGANSIRGYETGEVATSRSYVLASAEYRFPIYKFLGAAVFADIGSDLGSSDSVLGEPGVVRNKPGTGFGVGAGLRINSPIGIIRADWGFNDQGENRLQFGFGQRF